MTEIAAEHLLICEQMVDAQKRHIARLNTIGADVQNDNGTALEVRGDDDNLPGSLSRASSAMPRSGLTERRQRS
jgi:hypothetical protein